LHRIDGLLPREFSLDGMLKVLAPASIKFDLLRCANSL
jgi:hypothetical protein